MWYAVLAIATIALIALAAKHRDVLLQWLLPGDANVTETAMDGFIADIRNGMPGGEAVAAFCREIITYAAG